MYILCNEKPEKVYPRTENLGRAVRKISHKDYCEYRKKRAETVGNRVPYLLKNRSFRGIYRGTLSARGITSCDVLDMLLLKLIKASLIFKTAVSFRLFICGFYTAFFIFIA